jgi:hypothetical protein
MMAIQFTEKLIDDDFVDEILKEASDGYGDLIAAALVHNISVNSLQNRVMELRHKRVSWIS